MKTEQDTAQQWQDAYSREWDRLFRLLPADEQEAIKLAPSGAKSAELARQAYEFANNNTP